MNLALSGATFVRAGRDVVWAALHDTDLISLCIPGCRSLVRASDRDFVLALELQFGPFRLAYGGTVHIAHVDVPRSMSLVGQGGSGKVGAATGTAKIALAERFGGCTIKYAVEADMHGPLSLARPAMSKIGVVIASSLAGRFGDLVEGRRTLDGATA